MATAYVPDSTGWTGAAYGGGYTHNKNLKLRVVVTYTYTASTDTLQATFKVQGASVNYKNVVWYAASGATITIDGTAHSINSSSFKTHNSATTWEDATNTSFTVTKSPTNGSVSIPVSLNITYYTKTSTKYASKFQKSGTFTLSTTPTYTLSLSAGAHSGGTVKRNGTALSNGATISLGDTLVFEYAPDTGYSIGTHTVNGTTRSSGYSWTVAGAATVVTTATVISNTLTVSAGTGTTVTVNRQTSPLGGASTGVISSGATVYYNDTLQVAFTANTGYTLATHTIQGVTRDSGYVYTVKENPVSIVATAALIEFSLTITKTTGAQVEVNRTSSPIGAASTGVLTSGATLYTNDVLTITINADSDYVITAATLND